MTSTARARGGARRRYPARAALLAGVGGLTLLTLSWEAGAPNPGTPPPSGASARHVLPATTARPAVLRQAAPAPLPALPGSARLTVI